MEPVKVATVQAAPVLADRDATITKVIALAETAAAEGARLVAFPEAFVPGYPDWVWRTRPWDATATGLYARLLDQAVVAGSPATDPLADTARRLGIWLCVGAAERDEHSSTAWFVLAHLPGRGNVRVYDGSWAEWAACPIPRWTRPEATGTARHHREK
jgi:predicted amidohydrolase